MRTIRTTAVLAGLLLTVPALSLASTQTGSQAKPPVTTATKAAVAPAKPAAEPAKAAAAAATHATSGVIKSMDATSLVISRPSGKVKELTFVINSTTQHKGDLAVGSAVEVRYRTEGAQNIATAVTMQAKKK